MQNMWRNYFYTIYDRTKIIDVPDNYFDKVVASASFHHFSDQDNALEEMKLVLKPDGKMIIGN